MKKLKVHLRAKPPNLTSFTVCGLWIYAVGKKKEKLIGRVKEDITCERCKKSTVYKNL